MPLTDGLKMIPLVTTGCKNFTLLCLGGTSMRKVHIFWATLMTCLLSFPALAQAQYLAGPREAFKVVQAAPSNDDVARAVLKAFGALALHQASKPQPCDGVAEGILREISKKGRDELIDSALKDLSPASKPVERAAVRNLAILALDGQLPRDRNRVLDQLRRTNPDAADAVEITEFLIRLAQAVDRAK